MEQFKAKVEKEVSEIKNILVAHINDEKLQKEVLEKHMELSIEKSLNKYVNGKIDKVHKMLETQNEMSDAFHKKVDANFEMIMPYIQGFEGSKSVAKFFMWVGGIIITVGTAFTVIKSFFVK